MGAIMDIFLQLMATPAMVSFVSIEGGEKLNLHFMLI